MYRPVPKMPQIGRATANVVTLASTPPLDLVLRKAWSAYDAVRAGYRHHDAGSLLCLRCNELQSTVAAHSPVYVPCHARLLDSLSALDEQLAKVEAEVCERREEYAEEANDPGIAAETKRLVKILEARALAAKASLDARERLARPWSIPEVAS
jgi:hypothetical protein